jgi:DNA-binding response OmpR family regulator
VLNYGWHYIEKPFVPAVLVARIKEVLRGESREQSPDRFNTLKEPRKSIERRPVDFHTQATLRTRRRA